MTQLQDLAAEQPDRNRTRASGMWESGLLYQKIPELAGKIYGQFATIPRRRLAKKAAVATKFRDVTTCATQLAGKAGEPCEDPGTR
jgi:hypothetical protein